MPAETSSAPAPADNIGCLSAQAIAEEFGTPLYVYDAAVIQRQYRRLAAAFAAFPHRIQYAMKANSNVNILRLLKREGAGLDVVSIQEVQ